MSVAPGAVCLDAQGAQNAAHLDRGIPRFIGEHTRALLEHHRPLVGSVLLSPQRPLTGNLNWLLGTGLLGWATGDRRRMRRPSGTPAIYHVMSPFELERPLDEIWPQWARGRNIHTAVTLYDLIPLVFEDHYLRDPVIRERYLARTRLVREAERVFAISQTTAADAVERLGLDERRVTVIDAGATDTFAGMYRSRAHAEQVLASALPAVRRGFLLDVAGFEFRKNLERLIAAYGLLPGALRAAHQLVIACRLLPSEAAHLRSCAAKAGIADGELVLTGYVSDSDLGALYHACELFVFASFYEGSGLPILEAMSCGAPVVASSTATGPEILGGLDGTFDPLQPTAIADCIATALQDSAAMEDLRTRSLERTGIYTWQRVAARTVAGYEATLARPRAARRARLALVTPWPPERSGVADYSYRLARELGSEVDVDVVVGHPLHDYAEPREAGVRLIEAEAFSGANLARQHDRVLYCMGNSSFHRHVYELLRGRPGAVLAHDVRLTGFYGWFAGVENPGDPAGRLHERIVALYGQRIPRGALDGAAPTPAQQSALGIYMTREVQQYAEQLFVHSHFARDVLELDRSEFDRDVPIEVMPFGIPDAHKRKEQLREGGPLVVSIGVVSEVKGLAQLIVAFGLLGPRGQGAKLVIAGPGDDAELERWREFAREHAPGARIELPGYVDAAALHALLGTADLAVQLRTVSNGEASASTADCLAAGVATIVTEIGSGAEFPPGVVATVPPQASPHLLAETIGSLLADGRARMALAGGARDYATRHSFRAVAEAYLSALELG